MLLIFCCIIIVVLLWFLLWIFVDNAKLQRILDDDELPLFTGNNCDVGLCLAMNDDCREYVMVHSLSHIHFHTLWWPGLENSEEGLCLVDSSINWQIRFLNDDELSLFTSNNGDVGLCLAMDDDCCGYVMVHSLSHIHLHNLWWPGLANCEEGLCLVDAFIYWQIFKMGVLLQWYHMHVHYNWVTVDVASWVVVMIYLLLLYVVDLFWQVLSKSCELVVMSCWCLVWLKLFVSCEVVILYGLI